MANFHLRDLTPATLAILKAHAQANGRSLNAELLGLLDDEAERLDRTTRFLETVRPIRPRKPVDLEQLIREDREARVP